MNYYIIRENELYHHGVKGMKWGVRRYQNPDGSLTPAGKKRQQKQNFKDVKKYGRYNSDNVKAMTSNNKQLRDAIDNGESYVKKIVSAQHKLLKLNRDWDEAYDEAYDKHYKQYEKKNKLDRTDRYNEDASDYAHEQASREVNKKFRKRNDNVIAEYQNATKEYKQYVENTVSDMLGKYGDVKIRNRVDSGENSAAAALSDIIYWDNAVERDRINK